MESKKLTFKQWLKLSPEEQKKIYESWDKYKGEGEEIIKEVCKLFKEKFKRYRDVVNVSYGVYHGGDWIISVSLRVGHNVKVPDTFYGIRVVKLYDGLNARLKYRLTHKYKNNITNFVNTEIEEFRKCFKFKNAPYEKEWLIEFVKMHTGRYKRGKRQRPIDTFNENLRDVIKQKSKS